MLFVSQIPVSTQQPAELSQDPAAWVDAHGDYLFRFAITRVRNETQAEELVQDTFVAALKARANFRGGSAIRTWLTGILKHKIVDYYRRQSKSKSFTDLDFYQEQEDRGFLTEGLFQGGFKPDNHPLDWSDKPGRSLDREDFWRAFHDCTGKLPKTIAQVFLLREVEEMPSEEICQTLEITPNNLWVMLHRARLALRKCLEDNWIKPLREGVARP